MKRCVVCLLCCALLFCGCTTFSPTVKEITAMDTVMRLTVYDKGAETALTQAAAELERLDRLWDVNNETGDIGQINRHSGHWVTVDPATAELLTLAVDYAAITDGAFDPTVYPLVAAWGFTTDAHRVPEDSEIASLLSSVDYSRIQINGNKVKIPQNAKIDVGAIAKGYAADRIAAMLAENGAENGILDLGGNILTMGQKPDGTPFSVGIQDPRNTAALADTLSAKGGTAVVTSGDYQRYFEQDGVRYHHIIDPATGKPAAGELASVTILTDKAAYADAMATALFVMGKQKAEEFLSRHPELSAVMITTKNEVAYYGKAFEK